MVAVTRTVTVAAGRFAPGHLGELAAVVPFELVDAVLAEARAVRQRPRDLPPRVGCISCLRCACSQRSATGWSGTGPPPAWPGCRWPRRVRGTSSLRGPPTTGHQTVSHP
ncbi:transposase domain-containing protein [Streptomyces sp. NPDC015184]|uniref:transposase domain-containing protein n=1 Tax=Streptomyces sp. NPDC015184 TaxID=3364946 RepID=UPI0036FA3E98